MLNALHHVALICTDYQRSRRFYVETLGLKLVREVYREERQSWKADLRIGSSQLELFSFPAPAIRPSYPEATGLRHLAFGVEDLDLVIILSKQIRVRAFSGRPESKGIHTDALI